MAGGFQKYNANQLPSVWIIRSYFVYLSEMLKISVIP